MDSSIEAAKQLICPYFGRANKLHFTTYHRASMPGKYNVYMSTDIPDTICVDCDMNGNKVNKMFDYNDIYKLVAEDAKNGIGL